MTAHTRAIKVIRAKPKESQNTTSRLIVSRWYTSFCKFVAAVHPLIHAYAYYLPPPNHGDVFLLPKDGHLLQNGENVVPEIHVVFRCVMIVCSKIHDENVTRSRPVVVPHGVGEPAAQPRERSELPQNSRCLHLPIAHASRCRQLIELQPRGAAASPELQLH